MKTCADCKTVNFPHLTYCKYCGGSLYRSKTKQHRLGPKVLLDFLTRNPS